MGVRLCWLVAVFDPKSLDCVLESSDPYMTINWGEGGQERGVIYGGLF